MSESYDFGKKAEELAVSLLRDKGCTILERNYRYGKHEIDILACVGSLLISAEVKARKNAVFSAPEEAVDRKKIRNILSATDFYLQNNPRFTEVRFDVISVTKANDTLKAIHLEDAFQSWDI